MIEKIKMLEKLLYFMENELYLNLPSKNVRLSSLLKKDNNYDYDYDYYINKLKDTINIPVKDIEKYDNDIIAELKSKIRDIKLQNIIDSI